MSHADHDVIAAARDGDLMDDVSAFFAPTSTDMVDGLVAGYRQDRARIANRCVEISSAACAPANRGCGLSRFRWRCSREQSFNRAAGGHRRGGDSCPPPHARTHHWRDARHEHEQG